jgi:DNA mismatch endonuclease (patch repair protein)
MSLVRSSGTKPEQRLEEAVRRALDGRARFVSQPKGLPARPDIAIPKLSVTIFVHGCFWHCCPAHGRKPKSRLGFWLPKLDANVRRDKAAARALRAQEWAVWTIWEHDLTLRRFERTVRVLARRFDRRMLLLGLSDDR